MIEPAEREVPAAPAEVEPAFAEARALFLAPPKAGAAGWVLLGTLVLFAASMLHQRSASQLALLVAVLLFHEAGHWVGMRALGYADVRMFFIPFFGAAVSGRNAGGESWRQGVVLLLGPVPGILLSLPLLLLAAATHSRPLHDAGVLLLLLNALNLLPVAPLDGGRLFQLVLFSRNRLLETLFLGVAGLALVAFGIKPGGRALAVIGLLMLLSLPRQARVLKLAHRFRAEEPGLAAAPAELDEPRLRVLHDGARALSSQTPSPAAAAAGMRQIHDAVRRRPPSAGISAALLITWFGAALATVLGVGLMALGPRTYAWQEYREDSAGLAAEFPGKPERKTDLGVTSHELVQLQAAAHGAAFTVGFTEPIPEELLPGLSKAMAEGIGGSEREVLSESGAALAGHPARRYRIREGDRELLIAIGAVNGRAVMMQVIARPGRLDLEAAEHFFGSLRVLPPPPR